MIHLRHWFFYFVLSIFVVSCSNDPLNVDISDVQVSINFVHADSLLYNASNQKRIQLNHQFKNSFDSLYLFTFDRCLRIKTNVDTTFLNQINQFYKDTFIKSLEDENKKSFYNLTSEKVKIIDAFKYLKFHFPKVQQPRNIVFFNAMFSYNALATSKDIGVGLEWYYGSNHEIIKKLNIQNLYDYMKNSMDRKFLVRDIVFQWIYAKIQPPTDANFAEDMVSWGKLLYCIEAALPKEEKSIICRYSPDKFKWAEENEKNIWKYFVEQKLLFKNDELTKLGYFNEAPFTKGLPKEGPDRLGQFIGWEMVKKYMDSHSDITLEKLMKVPFAEIMQSYKID
jgi:hypothetical protein